MFNYFKSLLTDSAAKTISGLMLTLNDYKNVTEIINNRFGKKDLLISIHMNSLLSLVPVWQSGNVFAFCKLFDEITFQTCSLEHKKLILIHTEFCYLFYLSVS